MWNKLKLVTFHNAEIVECNFKMCPKCISTKIYFLYLIACATVTV